MPECAVCSAPASNKCARCKCVFYCSPAHQKDDWPAHKVECPRLAHEALAAVFHPCDEELFLRITTCLAQNGYHKEVGVMVQLNKAFWTDEQIWDAFKDVPGAGGRTRLMYASEHGFLDKVKWFIARGAKLNLGIQSDGTTPLMMASQNGRLEIVRELCERGANVNAAMTDTGYTSLIWASQEGHLEVVRELCERGANVNSSRTTDGFTALMAASEGGHLEIVRELGANVNAARTSDSFTALIWASLEGHLKVARLLLQLGADKAATTTDGKGDSAFSVAAGPHKAALQALCKPS